MCKFTSSGWSVLFALSCLAARVMGADDPSRVFTSPADAADERLHVVHGVDHPALFEPHYSDKANWEKRAAELRLQIRVAEGLWPEPERTPLNAVIHGKVERDGYTIEKVYFASLPGHYVSGNLYRPIGKPGKLPVVLSPHGHWANGRLYEAPEKEVKKQLEMGAEKTTEGARFPIQARCAMLARMGCIVFIYDAVGYADSQTIAHRTGFTDIEATLRLQSFMGLQTWNSIRALDFVCSLPDVDATRIAVTGASGGATQTLILCAIDPRPAVSFPAVMVSEAMQGGCICENAPLLRVETNNAEIASLFAPKPMGMSAANDWTRESIYKGFPQIRDIYKLYGVADDVAAWHRPFPHNYNQVSRELMYNWLNKYLKLGQPQPVVEVPFVPGTVAELSVYDADHPRPGDSLDAAGLRKQMTLASDQQLADLAKDPEQYRAVVGAALGAMVGDRLPASTEVSIADDRGVQVTADGIAMQKGTICRKGKDWKTPFVSLTPRNFSGTTVVWVDPRGKGCLFDPRGEIAPAARKLLDTGAAIVAPDLLLTGEAIHANGPHAIADKYANYEYPGYHFGYNRSLLASRTSDVLSAIALARGWEGTRSVRVMALGSAGVPALLAVALADGAVERGAIDLNHFDFANVHELSDEMILPGVLKYGGIAGIIPECGSTPLALWNLEGTRASEVAGQSPSVQIKRGELTVDAAQTWIVGAR